MTAAGVSAIEVIVAAPTVSVALLEVMPLALAVTVVVPWVNAVATPVADSVATAVLVDDHVTLLLRSTVVLSE